MPAFWAVPLVASTPVWSMIDPISIGEPVALPAPAESEAPPALAPAAGSELVLLPPPPLELLQAAAVRTIAGHAPLAPVWAARRARPRAPPAVLLIRVISLAFR